MAEEKQFIPIMIDGSFWAVMLPTGGTERTDLRNDWDETMAVLGQHRARFHSKDMYSWCQDMPNDTPDLRICRGRDSGAQRTQFQADNHHTNIGFRPRLIPLDPHTLQPDPNRLHGYMDGSTFFMGTLYMNELPLPNPHNPSWTGDIPNYIQGATLRIGNSDREPHNRIQWLKVGDSLIADRNLLKDISWSALHQNGLVYGHTGSMPVLALETGLPTPEYEPKAAHEEMVIQLAHLAGSMEASGHLEATEWTVLAQAIHQVIDAYLDDPSESRNPFALEDAAEQYFTIQFGTEEYRETAVEEGWAEKNLTELISEAKKTYKRIPELPNQSEPAFEAVSEDDKVIFVSTVTGDLWFEDVTSQETFLQEYSSEDTRSKAVKMIGVHTSPECVAAIHFSSLSALWDEIPPSYQEQPQEDLLNRLKFGKLYDVCYYYTKPEDPGTLYQGVDRRLTKGDILVKICSNKYMEGAVVYENQNTLTPEEYLAGMRFNTAEARSRMTNEQLSEVKRGVECGVDEKKLLRPDLSAAQLLKLRTELETENTRRANPGTLYEATDYGPEELCRGFKSESNFEKYPDRICYVPDLWGFDYGPGVKGTDILELCNGDALKAQMVFDRCDWQHPATVLAEWDLDDDLALEQTRKEQKEKGTPSFSDRIKNARSRALPPENHHPQANHDR